MTVAGMTAAALATIGWFGYQAADNVPEFFRTRHPASSPASIRAPAAASGQPGSGPGAPEAPTAPGHRFALPDHSGKGVRVVYSLGEDRVWLVAAGDKVRHTFKVVPAGVDPVPGSYPVTSRSGRVTGSDGVPVEHVVRFTKNRGTVIGFSAAVGPTPEGRPTTGATGGIRESQEDGTRMWKFALVGMKVVVVP
jgi:hypothetical protein